MVAGGDFDFTVQNKAYVENVFVVVFFFLLFIT